MFTTPTTTPTIATHHLLLWNRRITTSINTIGKRYNTMLVANPTQDDDENKTITFLSSAKSLAKTTNEKRQEQQQSKFITTTTTTTTTLKNSRGTNGRMQCYFPIYYNDVYKVQLPPNHRFPMDKYRQVREMVQQKISHLQNSSSSSTVNNSINCTFDVSPLASIEELQSTHSLKYITRYIQGQQTPQEIRQVGFPWTVPNVQRSLSSVGGTVAAALSVCEYLQQQSKEQQQQKTTKAHSSNTIISSDPWHCCCWGAHLAGGTHHAFYDRGEGFCVFSDMAVAANLVLLRYPDLVQRILILDLDVHQGNGNAVLFHNNPQVYTFSMHCVANYFSPKQQSDLDIELPIDCNDTTYLMTLRHWLQQLQQLSSSSSSHDSHFDMVFYQAGVDVLAEDRLGRMKLTANGIAKRNQLVFEFCTQISKQKNTSTSHTSKDQKFSMIPLIITMGGGYPNHQENWKPILDAHANVYVQAYEYLQNLKAI